MPPIAAFASLILSGFAALVFEVCWIRRASLVFGATTPALGTVLAVFFLGLAIGSEAFGRWSRAIRRPLRAFAVAEIGIALLALGSPFAFDLVDRAYGVVYRSLGEGHAGLIPVRAALVALVLLPPTILMGASLPLFCRAFVRARERIGGATGALYAANTLGAAAGAVITGLVLLPAVGIGGALWIGAAADLAAAGVAIAIGGAATLPRDDAPPATAARREPRRDVESLHSGVVGALFAITGFVALAGEVLWTRYLSLVIRSTVVTYTVTLTTVLLGIVIGSALAAALVDRSRARARLFGALQVLSGLATLVLLLLPPAFWERLGGGLGVQLLLLLPPAVLSGASFPIALRLVTDRPAATGAMAGRMLALNTAGGIAGSLAAGLWMLPRLGLQASILAVTGLGIVAGIAAALLGARGRARAVWAVAALAAAILWAWLPRALGTRLPADFLARDGTLLAYREGLAANVAVVRRGGLRELRIDRWWQGQSGKTHQIVAAHLPMLLHPAPSRVLAVGVGTGLTATRFLDYPIARLDCVDIEPAVFDVLRDHFEGGWLDDPRVRAIREDGRNYLAHAAERYDVISLELGQLFRPGVASFYTLDFYRRAADRLAPGGLVCQFVPISFLTVDQFRSVIGTFVAAFPHAVLWYNTSELLLVGGRDRSPRLTADRLRLLEADPRIHADLAYSPWDGAPHWLNRAPAFAGGYLCGSRALASMAGDAPLLRDDRPELEYAVRHASSEQALDLPTLALLRDHLGPIDEILDHEPSPADRTASLAQRQHNLADIECNVFIRQRDSAHSPDRVLALALEAQRANPLNHQAHRIAGGALLQLGRTAEAKTAFETALSLRSDDAHALAGLGTIAQMERRPEEAVGLYRQALAARPEDTEARNNLGAALAGLRRLDEAEREFAEAARLDPANASARRNLERVRAEIRAR